MKDYIKNEQEYELLKKEGRLVILDAALDSTCYFLGPDCNKCTHAVYVAGSKKCMYNLKTEMCYSSESIPDFDDAKSLGKPEYWEVNELILTIYYNKLFRGKFGRSIFTEIETALEMADKFSTLENDCAVSEDIENGLSYDKYIRLKAQNRIVILPCKVGDKYYVAEPDCTKCKFKNDGYKGCGYMLKKGVSPYACSYNNEFDVCRVFNQSSGDIIYIEPEKYDVKDIIFMKYGLLAYDSHRKSPYGVWTDKNKLIDILEKETK
jgi:hypothetical protein